MPTPTSTSPATPAPTYERRRYPRYHARLAVHFHRLRSREAFQLHESLTQDLGAGGLAMVSDTPIPAGQLIMLTLMVPDAAADPAQGGQPQFHRLILLSRVAWENPLSQTRFLQGIEFVEVAEEDRRKLHEYLEACRPA